MSTLDKNLLLEMFRKMEEIRRMDLKIAQLVKKGKVPGMTHFSVGEEAANVGAMLALNPDDLITSNHRGHGQAIAKGIDLNGMMAEILGKYTGTCKGKGGSMHIADLDAGNLGANGIVGGGVVGIELGQAFMTFGSKVTVIEMMDRIVPAMDVEVSKNLRLILERKGMTILTGTKLQEIIEENGQLRIKVEGKDDIIASKALLSIGRMPDLEGIGEVEFELDRGCIKVNEYMETSVPGIYAPGDINGTKMLAHAAFRMGEVSAENALKGNHAVAKLNLTPAAIYTLPEVAAVGLTEEQAREKYDVAIGKFNFAANGRAIASDAAQGFVKVIADKKYGEILGVHIIGPAAAELINEASSIIEMEITVEEMLKTIHGHPTYSEVMYEAFADVLGMAIHSPKKK
ncbi:hypothetical protein PC0870_10100 [Streptococcus pneumoniae]|nr:FAD-dependent oxidoreductase [Streptococcus pneumoniae]GKW55945.1 hypothetical protein PC0870_10100 [Streptococcus pneumoniae]